VVASVCLVANGNEAWEQLDSILDGGIAKRAFPGAVALVANQTHVLYSAARGTFVYPGDAPPPASFGRNPQMTLDTLFDMASVSKVMATTAAAAYLYQRGHLDLGMRVADVLPGYEANGKGATTVLNLLLHNAGLACDPSPGWWNFTALACPESSKVHPKLAYTCRARCYHALLDSKLVYPIGSKYAYCDVCLMAAGYVVGSLAMKYGYVTAADVLDGCPLDEDGWQQCYFEAFVRKVVFAELGLRNTMFNPPQQLWWNVAPAENDTWYRHGIVQGQIHDENTFAMGGIAGHAGVFSTAGDLLTFSKRWLFAAPNDDKFINAATVKLFTTMYNKTQSSRAIGWNTNDPEAKGYGDGGMCGTLSARTYLHTGFTGTLVCVDPDRKVVAILLNNRIYPTRDDEEKSDAVRRTWSTAVQKLFDAGKL